MPDATIKADAEDEEALAVHYGAKAWAAIKPSGDPEWNALPMEIRHKLIDLAKRYLAGHAEKEGDYAPAGFRDAVIGGPHLVVSTVPSEFDAYPKLGYNHDGIGWTPRNEDTDALWKDSSMPSTVFPEGFIPEDRRVGDIDRRSDIVKPGNIENDRRAIGAVDRRAPAPEPVRLVSGDYGTIQPDPLPESSLKGTITVEKGDDGVSATVNVDAPKPAKQKKK